MLPRLAEAEENDEIEGVLILLNTMGGDVEAGLGIAEMIASLGKPTVSLVLGGSHSIGGPLAVSCRLFFYCPVRHDDYSSGSFFWNVHRSDPELSKYGAYPGSHYPLHCVPFSYLPGTDRGADAGFNAARERCGDNAGGRGGCQRGMIDEVGGIHEAFQKLHELIDEEKEKSRKNRIQNRIIFLMTLKKLMVY